MAPPFAGAARPLLIAVILAVAASLALAPELYGLAPALGPAAGLTVLSLGLWVTGAIPEFVTTLLFFLLCMLGEVAPPSVVFSGFAAAAWWLVFSGLVLSVAVEWTGLAGRLAQPVARLFRASYPRLVIGVVGFSGGLGFLLPSTMGRTLLLVPIVGAIADRLGYAPGRPGRAGLLTAAVLGTYAVPAAILPANIPNIILAGTAETLYGETFTYGRFLLLHFPVLGLLKAAVIAGTVLLLFRDGPPEPDETAPERLSTPARRMLILLGLTLAFWTTDVFHGISPAWIGLAAAIACLTPRLGLLPADAMARRINLSPAIYVAGILGLAAVIAETGLGGTLSEVLIAHLPFDPARPVVSFLSLVLVGVGTGLVATIVGIPAVLTPLAGDLAARTGLPLETVFAAQIVAISLVLLPVQLGPLVVGFQLSGIRASLATRATLLLAFLSALTLVPLQILWLRLLGIL